MRILRKHFHLLGGRFQFESGNRELMRLVDHAYQGLPRHRFPGDTPRYQVQLMVTPESRSAARSGVVDEPEGFAMLQGAGFLGGAAPASTFVAISPKEKSALVCVSKQMLRFPYNTRYELIEFAVFTLASRVQHMVSLHAACIGLAGRGLLLMGASGSGKSTVALHCLLDGLDFISEDSVFVSAPTLLATGASNFLHVRSDSLGWFGDSPVARIIRRSPVIRRRSGVVKFEVDLRNRYFSLARAPLKVTAVVFLSAQTGGAHAAIRPLTQAALGVRLRTMQAYGASLPQWREFSARLPRMSGFELRRGNHPAQTVQMLRSILAY
jgi:hypothetical protein